MLAAEAVVATCEANGNNPETLPPAGSDRFVLRITAGSFGRAYFSGAQPLCAGDRSVTAIYVSQ
jgi:hypothetical protein